MPVYKTDAIVIRARDYGEADKILTLFSRENGKIQAIAKGVRKPKSRLRGGVQPLSYSQFLLHKGKTLDTVSQVEQKESFGRLLQDLERLTYAAYVLELVDAAILENEEGQEIFLLTLTCLHLLQSVDPALVIRCFELRLLNLLGYKPQTKNCVNCSSLVQGEKRRFSVDQGGVLCPKCRQQDTYSLEVSGGTLAVMDYLFKIDLKKLDRLKIPKPVNDELEYVIKKFISSKLEKRFKSLDFLSWL